MQKYAMANAAITAIFYGVLNAIVLFNSTIPSFLTWLLWVFILPISSYCLNVVYFTLSRYSKSQLLWRAILLGMIYGLFAVLSHLYISAIWWSI
ncbi:hypothetical protein KO489_07465 [Reinekea forsetii]|nr:hypothetical protein [Reinekea forsetii]